MLYFQEYFRSKNSSSVSPKFVQLQPPYKRAFKVFSFLKKQLFEWLLGSWTRIQNGQDSQDILHVRINYPLEPLRGSKLEVVAPNWRFQNILKFWNQNYVTLFWLKVILCRFKENCTIFWESTYF